MARRLYGALLRSSEKAPIVSAIFFLWRYFIFWVKRAKGALTGCLEGL
jgi:hypothetical protein